MRQLGIDTHPANEIDYLHSYSAVSKVEDRCRKEAQYIKNEHNNQKWNYSILYIPNGIS
jgi:hypothetical protein